MNTNPAGFLARPVLVGLSALLVCFSTADRASADASVGLSTVRARYLANPPVAEWSPEAGDAFADAVATGDFNGDGADDLAVGIPNDNGLNGVSPNSGLVVVWYGNLGAGLQAVAWNVLRLPILQDDARFGAALAAGDFDNDGYDDLAVGTPGFAPYGIVKIHHGSSTGLEELSSETLAFPRGGPDPHFGRSLAVGDFNGDFFADLAVGAPHTLEFPNPFPVGEVFLYHGPDLVNDPLSDRIYQDIQGVPDDPEENDLFGFSLIAGNFNSDQRCGEFGCAPLDDLVIGVPGEDDQGKVLVLFGSEWSLLIGSAHWFGGGEVGGTAELLGQFGRTFAVGDFDGDLTDDLAIAAPFTSVDGDGGAGQVAVLFGSDTAINDSWFDIAATRWLTQTTFYGASANAAGDFFGWSLAAGDFDHDGRDDLAVGHIGEDIVPGGSNLGGFTILTGSTANPHGPGARFRFFGAGYAGMPIPWADWDEFGWSLATGDFDGDHNDDLVIGAPFHDLPGVGADAGGAAVLYGALFADGFEWGGSFPFWSLVEP